MQPTIIPMGEAALLAENITNEQAIALCQLLPAQVEVISVTPAATSALVRFDPLRVHANEVAQAIRQLLQASVSLQINSRTIPIPTIFDGEDLPDAARTLGTTEREVIARLCAQPWRVMMIGFAPGFPYLGPLPASLTLPRRATPRKAVPAGSVAIAAGMAGIYPSKLPGGWHLLGRTDAVLFDATCAQPTLLRPGDFAKFVEVDAQTGGTQNGANLT